MKILLGVTGGIAAYKAPQLVRELTQRGDEVRVIVTQGAREFVSMLALQVVSGHTVGEALFDPTYESEIGHIELARWPDVLLIAPATAHTLAKLAHGLADDLLTTVALATQAPLVIAPAMNTQMWLNLAVQHNISALTTRGHTIVSPDSGQLACKEVGAGRLPDPPVLLAAVDAAIHSGELRAQRILITAGPTREHLDPARFISNPSTGKMGYAIAAQAARMGAEVTLVTGPTALDAPAGLAELVRVVSAQQMHEAVMARAATQHAIIKCAAVADWRPKTESALKRSKAEMDEALLMERNPDILAALGEQFGPGRAKGPLLIGFAAESHDVEARSAAKLKRKNAHWLVANQIGVTTGGFGADHNQVTLLCHDEARTPQHFGPDTKEAIARQLLAALAPELIRT